MTDNKALADAGGLVVGDVSVSGGGAVMCRLHGSVNAYRAGELAALLEDLPAGGDVVIDLGDVSFLDLGALGQLDAVGALLADEGRALRLVGPECRIARLRALGMGRWTRTPQASGPEDRFRRARRGRSGAKCAPQEQFLA